MNDLRGQMKALAAELRGEMNELRDETKAMAGLSYAASSVHTLNKMLLIPTRDCWVAVCCAMDFGVGGFRIARHSPGHY